MKILAGNLIFLYYPICPAQRKAKILEMRKAQINNLIPRGQLVSIKNERLWEKRKKPALVTAVTLLHLPIFFSKMREIFCLHRT